MTATNKMEEVVTELNTLTLDTLNQLNTIWDEINLEERVRHKRNEMFVEHVKNLYKDMLAEEEESKVNLENDIKKFKTDLITLGRDLKTEIIINDYKNESLYNVRLKLKSQYEDYQEMYNKRLAEVNKLLVTQKSLCENLGYVPKDLPISPLPTSEEVQLIYEYIEELSSKKFQREEEFLTTKGKIMEILDELKLKPSLEFERLVVLYDESAFKVTDENMKRLQEWYQVLETQRIDLKAKVDELREKISVLWELLEENPQVRSAFLEAHVGYSVDVLQNLKLELIKLEERKKANIKVFIEKMRHELLDLWNKCYIGEQKKAEFIHFGSNCYTEDLLSLFELEIEKYKQHYKQNVNIYKLVEKRDFLWEKLLNLEQREEQPDRYKNRGGQLLNEEKQRKSIASQLPKIESDLTELIKQYESDLDIPFLIFDTRIEDLLARSWQQHKENKRQKLSERKKLRENTPGNLNTFGSSRITPCVTASKRKLELPSTSVSSKRSRIDLRESNSKMQSKSTSKKISVDKENRLKQIRRRSKKGLQGNNLLTTDATYETFKSDINEKPLCRSSFKTDRVLRSKTSQSCAPPGSTPRRVLAVNNTPHRTTNTVKPKVLATKFSIADNLPVII